MAIDTAFPEPFGPLEKWRRFALPTEDARMRARLSADMADLTAFYCETLPHMKAIAEYLDRWPLTQLPDHTRPLLYLALMFMEAAMSVEFFKTPDVPEALGAEHMVVYAGKSERLVRPR